MLWHIVKREILDNLWSLRLSLIFILVILVTVISGLVFVGNYRQLVLDYSQNRNENLDGLRGRAKRPASLYQVSSFSAQQIYKVPIPLQFLAEGHEGDLPNMFHVRAFRVTSPQNRSRSNFMLWRFSAIDWTFVIGIIMSFAALILTYNGISGERERGTLRLTLSYPISRATILLGKYIGAMTSLAFPLIVGILFNLIIVNSSPFVSLGGVDWAKIALVTGLSLVYISIFAFLGLLISSLTRSSATSLIFLLLIWVILVILVPGSGGLLASRLAETPDQGKMYAQAVQATWDAGRPYGNGSFNWSPMESLPGAIAMSNAWEKVFYGYMNRLIRQVELARKITRISPEAIYEYACEGIAGTGLRHFEHFFDQVKKYKETLLGFVHSEAKKGDDKVPGKELYRLKVDFNAIPKFEEKPPTALEALKEVQLDVSMLFVFNVLFFMGAFVSFLRYDVR